jgi:hypothetical protein
VATPTPDPSPTPTPPPPPEDDKDPVYVHERGVTLRLDDGVARGRVTTRDGFDACIARVAVKIVRNGRVIERLETRANGRFRVEVPQKPGRYRAIAPQAIADDTNVCERARSKTRPI